MYNNQLNESDEDSEIYMHMATILIILNFDALETGISTNKEKLQKVFERPKSRGEDTVELVLVEIIKACINTNTTQGLTELEIRISLNNIIDIMRRLAAAPNGSILFDGSAIQKLWNFNVVREQEIQEVKIMTSKQSNELSRALVYIEENRKVVRNITTCADTKMYALNKLYTDIKLSLERLGSLSDSAEINTGGFVGKFIDRLKRIRTTFQTNRVIYQIEPKINEVLKILRGKIQSANNLRDDKSTHFITVSVQRLLYIKYLLSRLTGRKYSSDTNTPPPTASCPASHIYEHREEVTGEIQYVSVFEKVLIGLVSNEVIRSKIQQSVSATYRGKRGIQKIDFEREDVNGIGDLVIQLNSANQES